jgi:phosphatidylinositol alpha-1,6-mannosyltransferase
VRVLLLSENFPPLKGGSAIWLVNLYTRVANHAVSFAAGEFRGHHEFDAEFPHSVERIQMSMKDRDPTLPTSLVPYARIFRRIRRICRRDGIDQIHCGKVLPEGFVALLMKWFAGIPYVLYCHGEEITTTSESRRYRILVPLVYRSANAVIANAANTRRLLEKIGVAPEKIHVIRPSVPIDEFRQAKAQGESIRHKHGLSRGPMLLTVGRLQKRKGHDTVIRAMSRILASFPEATYVITGTGEERENLENLAETLGVADRVIFAGLVPDEELAGYYGACDLFLMPNRDVGGDFEGFGIVFLEAAAAQKPVIGGRSGGAVEAVVHGTTGLLVDGNRAEDVADAVRRLLSEPETARRMGEAGFRRARDEFGYAAAALDLEEIIEHTRPAAPSQRVATGRRTEHV